MDLSRRSSEPEWMDGEGVDYETFRGCLRDLARVNVLSGGYRPTLAFLDGLARDGRLPRGRPLRVTDMGSGYGDALRAIARWAAKRSVAVELTGVDLNPWSARAAAEATPEGGIAYVTGDAFDGGEGADVILSALFAHHLDDAGVVRFLRLMEERAALGWFVNDLHRHPLPYAAFGALARGLRLHPFVRHDGPVSFARAFVPADWHRFLAEASVAGATVRRRFPFRLCVARVC